MTVFFAPASSAELRRAFALLPGGPQALDAHQGAQWEYLGTTFRQSLHGGQWEHAFVHRAHPQLGDRRIELWVGAAPGWAPVSDEATPIPALGALRATAPADLHWIKLAAWPWREGRLPGRERAFLPARAS